MQHQLFVMHFQTVIWPQLIALIVHGRDGRVPLGQTLPIRLQVEPRDGHLPRDHRVDGGAAVPDHEDELPVGEEGLQVEAGLERERVLVA